MAGLVWVVVTEGRETSAVIDNVADVAKERESKNAPIPDEKLKKFEEALTAVRTIGNKIVAEYRW